MKSINTSFSAVESKSVVNTATLGGVDPDEAEAAEVESNHDVHSRVNSTNIEQSSRMVERG